jgi:adenylate cyclase
MAGMAEDREAAILMLDIRGFTPFANSVEPRVVLDVLTVYHSLTVPIVQKHNGVIDKFLGDGVMATFGAVSPSATAERDALRALEAILAALDDWDRELARLGCRPLTINAAVASGRIVFATIGNEQRLEYTVIGDPANLASKLEKHNKTERTLALAPRATYERAVEQGYEPAVAIEAREGCRVAGTEEAIDLVAFRRPGRSDVAA